MSLCHFVEPDSTISILVSNIPVFSRTAHQRVWCRVQTCLVRLQAMCASSTTTATQGGDLLGWSIGLDCSHHKHFDWVLWLSFEVTWAFSLPIVQKVISPYCPYWKIWLGQLKHIWLRRLDFRLAPRPAATRTRICLGVVPRTEVPAVRHWRKFSSDYGLIHVNSFGSKMDGFISFIPILWLHGYIPSWDDVACRSSWWRAPWPDSKS